MFWLQILKKLNEGLLCPVQLSQVAVEWLYTVYIFAFSLSLLGIFFSF